MEILPGYATPLGTSLKPEGVNFALFSKYAKTVILSLFIKGEKKPFAELPLDPTHHKTGDIWHLLLKNPPPNFQYAYRVDGDLKKELGGRFDPTKWLIDPYAKALSTPAEWGGVDLKDPILSDPLLAQESFNWEGDHPLNLPWEETILYEAHVRGYTQDASSTLPIKGTFLSLIQKIPHLKSLGVTALELLPVCEFNESAHRHTSPKGGKLFNYWGYSTVSYFAPMPRYSSQKSPGGALYEFKQMVKALHKAGIEVILDIVLNHTAELDETGPTLSFRGIDNPTYYLLDEKGDYLDLTGCGNTIQSNELNVSLFILDILRYWVDEMHVDGFRFDLASIFCRGPQGRVLEEPLILKRIAEDPLLSKIKLIVEPWDCAGLYQVGCFPGGDRFAEWNGRYRDTLRRFLKGTDGQAGEFAQALCGSENLYGKERKPFNSINFITAHDGYSLKDLVSYQNKYNIENGEDNQDGNNQNDSWNCGAEGLSQDPAINGLRERQMRNFFVALMVSLGTPMILMGDEYGHTRFGNNNPYCQDNSLNYFLWDKLKENALWYRFFQKMVQFRKENLLLQRKEFLTPSEVIWHGHLLEKPDWTEKSRFIAYSLQSKQGIFSLYIAFNAHYESAHIQLPLLSKDKVWKRIVDTSLEAPEDFSEIPFLIRAPSYLLPSYSSLILKVFEADH